MRYLLEDRGDYFGILNEASDTYVAYVHPQKIDLRRGRYRIVDREGDEITAVVSIDDALGAFAAHVSAHPPHWEQRSSTEYDKKTVYGDTLRVRQNRACSWSAYRDDRELGDQDGPVRFSSAHEAQRVANLHISDGYLNLGCRTDGLCWLGGSSIERYRIGDQLGEIVAAAVCAIGRALVGQCSGDTQTEAQQTAAIQLARLSAILRVSRVGSFDTDGRRREAYFTAKDKTYGGAPSRMSFDEAVQHYGKIALRKRLASDTSEAVLRELVSWPLHGLDCTFDHLLRRVTARTARQNSQKWLAEPQAARSR